MVSEVNSRMAVLAVTDPANQVRNKVLETVKELELFEFFASFPQDPKQRAVAGEKAKALLAATAANSQPEPDLQKMVKSTRQMLPSTQKNAEPLIALIPKEKVYIPTILKQVAAVDETKQAEVVEACVELLKPLNKPWRMIPEAFVIVQAPYGAICQELVDLMPVNTSWEVLLIIQRLMQKCPEDTHADLQQKIAAILRNESHRITDALKGLEWDIQRQAITLESDGSTLAEEKLLIARISVEPAFEEEAMNIPRTKRVQVLKNLLFLVPDQASLKDKIAVLRAVHIVAKSMSERQLNLLVLQLLPVVRVIKDLGDLPQLLLACANQRNGERNAMINTVLANHQ